MTAPIATHRDTNGFRHDGQELRTRHSQEVRTLRVARYMLAQYVKLLKEALDTNLDTWDFPSGELDYRDFSEDYGLARNCIAAITPRVGDLDDHVTGIETPYPEHVRHILTVAQLTRDKEDKEDESRRIQRIYEDYIVTGEEHARRILSGLDKTNEWVLDRYRAASFDEAFANLLSLEKVHEYARATFKRAYDNWRQPRDLVADWQDRIDRTTSVDSNSYINACDILQACACTYLARKRPAAVQEETAEAALPAAIDMLNLKSAPVTDDTLTGQGAASYSVTGEPRPHPVQFP